MANNQVLLINYPGSKLLNKNGWSANTNDTIAATGRIYEVKATATQVYLYYENWLMTRNWYHCRAGVMPGDAYSVMGYVLGKYQKFYIAVDSHQQGSFGGLYPKDATVYQELYYYSSPHVYCYPPQNAEVNSPNSVLGGYVNE